MAYTCLAHLQFKFCLQVQNYLTLTILNENQENYHKLGKCSLFKAVPAKIPLCYLNTKQDDW